MRVYNLQVWQNPDFHAVYFKSIPNRIKCVLPNVFLLPAGQNDLPVTQAFPSLTRQGVDELPYQVDDRLLMLP